MKTNVSLTVCAALLAASALRALPEERSVLSLMGAGAGCAVEVDRDFRASALIFRGEHPLTLRSDGRHMLTAEQTDVRADAVVDGGVSAFGPVTADPGKTLTVTVPAGTESAMGLVSLSGPAAGGTAHPGGTLRKLGAGTLMLTGTEPYLLDGATLEIADGALKMRPRPADGDRGLPACAVRLRGGTVAFSGPGTRRWESDGDVTLLGTVGVSVAEGTQVDCRAALSGGTLTKSGPGTFAFRPTGRRFSVNVAEGLCLADSSGTDYLAVSVAAGAAVGCGDGSTESAVGALTFEPGAALWYRSDTRVLAADRLVASSALKVRNLPAKPRAGVRLLKSPVRGLDFELPETWKGFSVFYRESAGCYEICQSSDAELALTADRTWTPAFENYGTLTLALNGHTLTVTGRTIVNRLKISGRGTVRFGEGAMLGANRIRVSDSVTLPEAMVLSDGRGVTPPLEIAEGATVTVTADAPRVYTSCISGLRSADGTVGQGGCFRKLGRGRLALRGMAGVNTVLDRVAVEIDGGRLATEFGTSHFRTRGAELRFLSGSTVWDYSGNRTLYALEGPLKVHVAKGHRIACDSWQAGGMIKTGEGAYQCCLDSGYRSDIREGYWIPETGGDSKSSSLTTVRRGAWVLAGRNAPTNGTIVFEAGSGVSLNNGPLYAARITAKAPILLEGPAEAFAEGSPILYTPVGGLEFVLPRGTDSALGVFFDGSVYTVRKTVDAEIGFDQDTAWEDSRPFGLLTLKPNGHRITVKGRVRARVLVIDGETDAGELLLAKGASLKVGRLVVCASVKLPADVVSAASETDGSPSVEIASGEVLTVASDTRRFLNSPVSGPRLEGGTVLRGGTLLMKGRGPLVLRGCLPRSTDSVTVAIDGGQLVTVPGTAPIRFRKTELRFLSGSRVWEYRHGRSDVGTSEEGPLKVHVAGNHEISCDMWLAGGLVKTGRGALRFCQNHGFCAEIREGTWLPETGNDSKSSAVTFVCSGAAVACGGPGVSSGKIVFGDGARLLPANGALCAPTVEARGVLNVGLPADKAADGTVLLATRTEGLRFALPESCRGFRAAYENGRYLLRRK